MERPNYTERNILFSRAQNVVLTSGYATWMDEASEKEFAELVDKLYKLLVKSFKYTIDNEDKAV